MDYDRLLKRYLNGNLPQEEYNGLPSQTKAWLEKQKKCKEFINSHKGNFLSGSSHNRVYYRQENDKEFER